MFFALDTPCSVAIRRSLAFKRFRAFILFEKWFLSPADKNMLSEINLCPKGKTVSSDNCYGQRNSKRKPWETHANFSTLCKCLLSDSTQYPVGLNQVLVTTSNIPPRMNQVLQHLIFPLYKCVIGFRSCSHHVVYQKKWRLKSMQHGVHLFSSIPYYMQVC